MLAHDVGAVECLVEVHLRGVGCLPEKATAPSDLQKSSLLPGALGEEVPMVDELIELIGVPPLRQLFLHKTHLQCAEHFT
jgi:hypothetical protein